MWTILFIVLNAHAYGYRPDDVHPKNLAVIAGEPMWFLCGTPSNKESIWWKVKKIGQFAEELISNGSYIAKAYQAANVSIGQSTTGNSLLSKNCAELGDAGTYKCIRTASRSEWVIGIGTAQLIVFGSKPECRASSTTIQEGEYLRLSCNMSYNGSLIPVIECSGIAGIHRQVLSNANGIGNVTVFTKNQMLPSDNGRNVTCTTYFETPAPIYNRSDAQKAENAPEFRHEWIYRTEVLFSPKSVDIDPRRESYAIGEVIHCIADGNPIPLYTWKENGSDDFVSYTSTLVVNEIRMQNRTYECTAENTRGSISTSVTIRISTSNSNPGMNLIPGVTVVAGVLCAILIVSVLAITIKRILETSRLSAEREIPSGTGNVLNEEGMHHLGVDADESRADNLDTEYGNSNIDLFDNAVLQDDINEKLEEGGQALRVYPDNPLYVPETTSAYTQLGHRSAVLVPPVYESLEDYELVPEVSNTQTNNVEEHQVSPVQKELNAEQSLAKTLYMNVGQIRKADDYMNVAHMSMEKK